VKRALLALTLLAAIPAAAGEPRAVVQRDGVWSEMRAPFDNAPVSRAWVWSDDAAPRLFDGAQWKAGAFKSVPVHDNTIDIQLVRKDRRQSVTVIAAPAQMWRQVPEALLPRFETGGKSVRVPYDSAQPWRARAIGKTEGSAWTDLEPRAPLVALSAAANRTLSLLGADGKPAAGADIELLRQTGSARPEIVARLTSDTRGRITIPSLPDIPLKLVIRHRDHALAFVSVAASELPLTQRLEAGSTLSGRFMRGDTPLAGVAVEVEGFISNEVPHLFSEAAVTADDGTFSIAQLPHRTFALSAKKKGFVPYRATMDVNDAKESVGDVELEQGLVMTVLVTDDRERLIEGASVDAGSGRAAMTNAEGIATLADIAARGDLRVTVGAKGHLTQKAELQPPFNNARVRLQRAFVVTGRLTDADHVPIGGAAMRIEAGRSYRVEATRADGTFEVSLAPGAEVKLAFSPPSAAPVTVAVNGGGAAEVRDIGDVTAPKGLVVAGRVIAPDGTPVAGGRLWSPRPSPFGPLASFMNGDVIETTTAADGAFVLSGLEAVPLLLRVEAQGFARAYRSVALDASVPRVELGDITLAEGATLHVRTRIDDAVARHDPRGEGLDIDMLTATVRHGDAVIPRVPGGKATLMIERGHRTLCETTVTVPEQGELDVECAGTPVKVRGRVLLGSAPAHSGSLSWTSPSRANVASAVIERVSAGGLRQQQAWGVADPPVVVEVDETGGFETDQLRPGRWSISYASGAGGSAAQQLEIPEQPEIETTLRFADTVIRGVVVDGGGAAVSRAIVEVNATGVAALAEDDGSFVLRGLLPGEHEVRARARDGKSAAQRVQIEAGREVPPVRLVLEAERPSEITITVTRAGGAPASGAFVFADLEGEGQRILTADAAGKAMLRLSRSAAARFRLAAYDQGIWAFQPWRERSAAAAAISVERGGELAVLSDNASGAVEIVRNDGWNLSNLMRRIGAQPLVAAGTPFRLSGVAGGSYSVTLGTTTLQADVAAGRERELRFK
jgi:hypothetical protein